MPDTTAVEAIQRVTDAYFLSAISRRVRDGLAQAIAADPDVQAAISRDALERAAQVIRAATPAPNSKLTWESGRDRAARIVRAQIQQVGES